MEKAGFSGIVAFKAGMTHVGVIEHRDTGSKGNEVIRPATILEIPKMKVYGIRLYSKKNSYTEPKSDFYSAEEAAKLGIKKTENTIAKLADSKKDVSGLTDAAALVYFDGATTGSGNKRVMRLELHVGGKDVSEKIAFIESQMGKEINVKEFATEGEYLDMTAVTKGRGWAGVIKRFGVARLVRKATQKTRHVGTLGAWHPPKVLYTVPHAGHMGFNYRTEINKRLLKVGTIADVKEVAMKGGILNYGIVKSDFLIVDGSIPGVSKRLIRIRKAMRPSRTEAKPELKYISLESKQGA